MQLSLDTGDGAYYIRGYKPGQIQINEQTYHRSVIITPTQLVEDWQPQSLAELTAEQLKTVASFEPEVVIIGTGQRQIFPHAAVLAPLLQSGIGVEVMDTAAACRTYNLLMSEGRKVVAALLLL